MIAGPYPLPQLKHERESIMKFLPPLVLAAALSLGSVPANAFEGVSIAGVKSGAERSTIISLLDQFNGWIADNTSLTPNSSPIRSVRFVDSSDPIIASGQDVSTRHRDHGRRNRGLYDPDSATIYITRPWKASDPYDQSILLHELVHHAQVGAKHWYCPQAMEWDAYKLQDKWLAARQIESDFNWTSILLKSSCPTGDHHPD